MRRKYCVTFHAEDLPKIGHFKDEDDKKAVTSPSSSLTSPSMSLEKALELAMKAKEELNKHLPHTAAIGGYRELLEGNQRLQWNACISKTDTKKQFKLTLTQGKEKYTFSLNFKDSTATQVHFEMVPHNKQSKDLINTKALTVTKRSDSAQLGSAEYFELNIEKKVDSKIQKKVVLFERYFELDVGGKKIAIQSMR